MMDWQAIAVDDEAMNMTQALGVFRRAGGLGQGCVMVSPFWGLRVPLVETTPARCIWMTSSMRTTHILGGFSFKINRRRKALFWFSCGYQQFVPTELLSLYGSLACCLRLHAPASVVVQSVAYCQFRKGVGPPRFARSTQITKPISHVLAGNE